MKVYILTRACIHTGKMLVWAKDSNEAIRLANRRTNEDWVITRVIEDNDLPQILCYKE